MPAKKKSPVSKWKPASQKWIDAFDAALPADIERRKMFGYPAAFVNGNMAAGLHQDGLVLRLNEEDRASLLEIGGRPFVVMGRTMGGYVLAPENFTEKRGELKKWLGRSIGHAKSLPPKKKKGK